MEGDSRECKLYPSDSPAAARKKYETLKASGHMKPTGALKYTFSNESQKQDIQNKIEQAKKMMNSEQWNLISNGNLLRTVLDYFLQEKQSTNTRHSEATSTTVQCLSQSVGYTRLMNPCLLHQDM